MLLHCIFLNEELLNSLLSKMNGLSACFKEFDNNRENLQIIFDTFLI